MTHKTNQTHRSQFVGFAFLFFVFILFFLFLWGGGGGGLCRFKDSVYNTSILDVSAHFAVHEEWVNIVIRLYKNFTSLVSPGSGLIAMLWKTCEQILL